MARILQDGFETEGKELDTSWITKATMLKLDVAELVSGLYTSGTGLKLKTGICSSRGGYGQKGYQVMYICDRAFSSSASLKYDLTKYCNDTSELFYRVWFNPNPLENKIDKEYTKLMPIAITNIEGEKKVDDYYTYKVDTYISDCHCVLVAEQIDLQTYLLKCYCCGELVYTYNFLNYNQWVKLDVRLKVGDAENGIFQLRINDKLITTYNGLTGTDNPKYLYIGKPFSTDYTYCQFAVDDVAINDTTGNVNNGWCGNGSIVGIVPTANGSKTMFTPGIEGTQNFENVDDLVPDGDVTYNSSYALGDIDLFKFIIPEELKIPPTETINAITVTTSAKFVEQPTDIGHIVSDGVSETVIGQHTISNDYTPQSSILQEKTNGTKYKVSDIANLEFGYKSLESTQAQEE